jgi:DNA repair protein RadC
LSQELLSHFGSLPRLLEASITELRYIKGIGLAKAVQLRAVFAIARRSKMHSFDMNVRIDTPAIAFEIAREEIAHCKQEVLLAILQDVRGRLICKERVGMGTLSELLIHPREIFYPAIRHKAHSLILAHNHPSGDPSPSQEDLSATRALVVASRTMGIHFIDHLIISETRYTSLREQGYLGDRSSYFIHGSLRESSVSEAP